MAFMIAKSSLMQATITTLGGLPACLRRSANALITGWHRRAESAAMYSTARRSARPPQMKRFPQRWPLSLAKGATPANEAFLAAVQCPQLGTFHQQGPCRHLTDARNAAQEILLHPPEFRGAQTSIQITIDLGDTLLQPSDVRFQVLLHFLRDPLS